MDGQYMHKHQVGQDIEQVEGPVALTLPDTGSRQMALDTQYRE
jgi:hypothetical protein